MKAIKLSLMIFYFWPTFCWAQLSSTPIERLEIISGNILHISPNAQSVNYSYLKKNLDEPLSGSESINKFDETMSVGKGEEVDIFENHTSFSIKSTATDNEFLLSATYNTLSFKGNITFQQSIIKKDQSGKTIIKAIKNVKLTAEDALNLEKSGLPLEDYVNSDKFTGVQQDVDETSSGEENLRNTPKIEIPSDSKINQKLLKSQSVVPLPKYNGPKFLWPLIGIGLLALSAISFFVCSERRRR